MTSLQCSAGAGALISSGLMRQATYAAAEEYVVHHDYGSGGMSLCGMLRLNERLCLDDSVQSGDLDIATARTWSVASSCRRRPERSL